MRLRPDRVFGAHSDEFWSDWSKLMESVKDTFLGRDFTNDVRRLLSGGARNDFYDLVGYGGLADAIHIQSKRFD